MDKFGTQFEDLDVATGYYEDATSQATAAGTPQDSVDKLMAQVADEAGVERSQQLNEAQTASEIQTKATAEDPDKEDILGERLRALRN